uniref:Uncharacterized protein n=1 Tax=viral metagenome TaxID=1070528 RepID=A0A6H1Z908_9ZZZZ
MAKAIPDFLQSAVPMMLCPSCEDYMCGIIQMEVVPDRGGWLLNASTYYLLASCPCGAHWAAQFLSDGGWHR